MGQSFEDASKSWYARLCLSCVSRCAFLRPPNETIFFKLNQYSPNAAMPTIDEPNRDKDVVITIEFRKNKPAKHATPMATKKGNNSIMVMLVNAEINLT
jgi:hypothetical protein